MDKKYRVLSRNHNGYIRSGNQEYSQEEAEQYVEDFNNSDMFPTLEFFCEPVDPTTGYTETELMVIRGIVKGKVASNDSYS